MVLSLMVVVGLLLLGVDRRRRHRCRVQAVGRGRELGRGRLAGIVRLRAGRQLHVRHRHDAAQVRQLGQERADLVVPTLDDDAHRHLAVVRIGARRIGPEHHEGDAGLLARQRDLAQQRRQILVGRQQLRGQDPLLVELTVLGLEAGQVRDRRLGAREVGGLLLVRGLELVHALLLVREPERQHVGEEEHVEHGDGADRAQHQLLKRRILQVHIGHGVLAIGPARPASRGNGGGT